MDIREDQNIRIVVTDIQGRIVSQQQNHAAGYYKDVLPVSDLPSGVYFLRVEGEKGWRAIQKISIVH